MASKSKKGACSSNTQAAKSNCLKHNRREQVPCYVNPHLTHLNRTVFESDMVRDYKNLTPLLTKAQKLYTEKTGQKCQKSFTPYRESCLVIRQDVTDKQLMQFVHDAERLTGWKAVGIWVHLDEGHNHSKYVEGDEDWHVNAHAHVLWACQDQSTGKIMRPTRDYFRKMQDLLAKATGMERGNPATETGRKHLDATTQREQAQEARLAELHALLKDREKENETLAIANKALKAANQTLAVSNAAKEKLLGFLGQSGKDKTIKALSNENADLKERIGKADEERDQAKTEAKNAFAKGAQSVVDSIFKVIHPNDFKTRLNAEFIVKEVRELKEREEGWYYRAQEYKGKVEKLERQLDQGNERQMHR